MLTSKIIIDSFLLRSPGIRIYGESYLGFESLSLQQKKVPDQGIFLLSDFYKKMQLLNLVRMLLFYCFT